MTVAPRKPEASELAGSLASARPTGPDARVVERGRAVIRTERQALQALEH